MLLMFKIKENRLGIFVIIKGKHFKLPNLIQYEYSSFTVTYPSSSGYPPP
jgi:hypothetical protein